MTRGKDNDTERPGRREKLWILLAVFAAVQVAILVCLFTPWFPEWQGPVAAFLALEVVFLVVLFTPLFLYHYVKRRKGAKESLRASLDTFLDWMGYLTP